MIQRNISFFSWLDRSNQENTNTQGDDDGDHDNSSSTIMSRVSSSDSLNSVKSVRFGECEVRAYNQVMGDHPCCSVGYPIQLGWEFEPEDSMSVDDFEASKTGIITTTGGGGRSKIRRLSPQERSARLFLQGYSGAEVRRECRRLNKHTGSSLRKSSLARNFFVANAA